MAVIKAQKIPSPKAENPLDIIARLCYYYPQYTFKEAKELPFPVVKRLIRVANNEQCLKMIYLSRVMNPAYQNKNAGKKVVEYFQGKILEES